MKYSKEFKEEAIKLSDEIAALLLHFFKFVLSFFIFDVENRDLLEMTGY